MFSFIVIINGSQYYICQIRTCLPLNQRVVIFLWLYAVNTETHYHCIDKHDGIDRISKYKLNTRFTTCHTQYIGGEYPKGGGGGGGRIPKVFDPGGGDIPWIFAPRGAIFLGISLPFWEGANLLEEAKFLWHRQSLLGDEHKASQTYGKSV
jgi:hypothetical protein